MRNPTDDARPLSDAETAVMDAIIAAPFPWIRVANLLRDGHSPVVIALLKEDGLLVYWELDSGLRVTLTPLATRRLEVRILEDEDDVPRWSRGTYEPSPVAKLERGFVPWPIAEMVDRRDEEEDENEEEAETPPESPYVLDADGEPLTVMGVPVRRDLPQSRRLEPAKR